MNRPTAPRLRWLALSLTLCVLLPARVEAAFSCGGALSLNQITYFRTLFRPAYYRTTKARDGAPDAVVSAADREALKSPRLAAIATLDEVHAKELQTYLNQNSADPVPGWVSTVVGLTTGPAGILVGLFFDVGGQVVNWSGSDGRLLLANLAGTVTPGGIVEAYERVVYLPASSTKPEDQRFQSAFVYRAVINGVVYQTTLAQCTYDIAADPLAALPRRNGSSGAALVEKSISQSNAEASDPVARDMRLRAQRDTLLRSREALTAEAGSQFRQMTTDLLNALQPTSTSATSSLTPTTASSTTAATKKPVVDDSSRYYAPLGCVTEGVDKYGSPQARNGCGRPVEIHFTGGMTTVIETFPLGKNGVLFATCEKNDGYDRARGQCKR